jgi:hypothetical protein
LLIKYIKSVLWRVVKCLSYTEDARCLKVKQVPVAGAGVNRPNGDANHSTPCSAEGETECSYAFNTKQVFMACTRTAVPQTKDAYFLNLLYILLI